ncbi:peptide-methionine (R)-S-oxide reductase MsrB [Aquirufa sp. A-Brett2-15D]
MTKTKSTESVGRLPLAARKPFCPILRYEIKENHMKKILGLVFLFMSLQACGQQPKQTPKQTIATTATNTMENLPKTEAEWKAKLTEDEYYILRQKGTERPYTGKFLMHTEKGMYTCRGCGAPLFSSNSKFDSHCGWPSFDKEVKAGVIKETVDNTLGMRRVEITCAKCGGHLGHVFDDGPTDTGLRYCVNSVSIGFEAGK